jgi:chorismate synthase
MSLRLTTAGESHGPGLTCIVEGLPAGLVLDRDAIDRDLSRRQLGHGRGGRMKIERDRAEVHLPAYATAARWAARSPSRSSTATTPTGRSG